MATETLLTETDVTAPASSVSALEVLLHHLKQNGYKPVKDEAELGKENKEEPLMVVKHGRKELIDVRGLSTFSARMEIEDGHMSIADHLLHSVQSLAEALLFSFLHVGKYFKGEKVTSALALPDTERYRQILEKLGDYFTENNLDFKIYLVKESGAVEERNLNVRRNKSAVPDEVIRGRKALGE